MKSWTISLGSRQSRTDQNIVRFRIIVHLVMLDYHVNQFEFGKGGIEIDELVCSALPRISVGIWVTSKEYSESCQPQIFRWSCHFLIQPFR